METTNANSWSDMAQPCDMDLWVMKWRPACPKFHVPVILSYILTSIDICTSYFGIMNQYDLQFDLKINVGPCDLHFKVQWFGLISWSLFDVCTSYFMIMNQYDPIFGLKKDVGHCDLYFMVQWFCLISWRLFGVWTSLFGILDQYDTTLDLKINVGLCDLYFMVQWFCHISNTIWCMSVIFSDNETVWPKLWPQSKYKSTLPIFHGLVILLNIF